MKILIGLSGGLDSTYAAFLLKKEGHDVTGAAVLMHEYTDIASAKLAAEQVGIPFTVIDARDVFEKTVVGDFTAKYSKGKTPNPCIICNPEVKFRSLYDYAAENGFDRIATGHYSSVGFENGRYFIRAAKDRSKDQSYMLSRLCQRELSVLSLPLSDMNKADVREAARRAGLSAAEAKDSLEICFVPDGNYASFIEKKTGKTFPEGNFIDGNGTVLGKHRGIINYTVGQRKGLGIALCRPMYVSKIDAGANTVTLVPSGSEYTDTVRAEKVSFMKLSSVTDGLRCSAKVRYSSKTEPCTVISDGDDDITVRFDSPVRAACPGQSIVLYDGDDVLMSGIIK